MEGATHFIELYKIENVLTLFRFPSLYVGGDFFSSIHNIKEALKKTKDMNQETIAVWYIKPKVKSL